MQARFPDKLKKQSSKTKIYKKPQKTYEAKGNSHLDFVKHRNILRLDLDRILGNQINV